MQMPRLPWWVVSSLIRYVISDKTLQFLRAARLQKSFLFLYTVRMYRGSYFYTGTPVLADQEVLLDSRRPRGLQSLTTYGFPPINGSLVQVNSQLSLKREKVLPCRCRASTVTALCTYLFL